MSHIDWRAVQFVIDGDRLRLRADEKRMVIRRVAHRMLDHHDRIQKYGHWSPANAAKITADQMAERMVTTARSVQRFQEELRPADKRVCPVCREPMWVYDDGIVEPHPTPLMEECDLSGRQVPKPVRGLAAIRPDLYAWLPMAVIA